MILKIDGQTDPALHSSTTRETIDPPNPTEEKFHER